ncbi:hypothetical protein JXA32_05120 [Candidatus Sumerlaeota bacterium]|nr:hypothetical protein [Candidatus Sumerlaeota bacterium]
MRRIIGWAPGLMLAALLLATALHCGCTRISVTEPDGRQVRYLSLLQKKSLQAKTPDGWAIDYSTDSNAAVRTAEIVKDGVIAGLELGAQTAAANSGGAAGL